jgi:nitroreductase/dihydropteridine reductase
MEGIDVEAVNEEFKEELAGYRCEVALAIGYHHPKRLQRQIAQITS